MSSSELPLLSAPFHQPLLIANVDAVGEARLILRQLGLHPGKIIEKLHVAPLGEPLTLRIGTHQFALRKEICRMLSVVKIPEAE